MSLVAVFAAPVFVHAAGAAPASPRALSISPVAFDFGEIAVGETSPPQEVVVKNVSATPVDVSGLTVDPIAMRAPATDPPQFVLGTTTCSGSLAAGASCTVPFHFTPEYPIGPPVEGDTTITVNGQTVDVSFVGTGLEPFLVSPTGLDFGPIVAGTTSATQYVDITNVTDTPQAAEVELRPGTSLSPFFPFHDGCEGLLAPGATCQLEFAFHPTQSAMGYAASLFFQVGGQRFEVDLKGNGVAEGTVDGVYLTPNKVDFGTRFVGIPEPGITSGGIVYVTGTETYQITSITDPSNPEFERIRPSSQYCDEDQQLSTVGQVPFLSCSLDYTYTPRDWGPPDTSDVTVVLEEIVPEGVGPTWELTLTLTGSSMQPFLVTPIGFDFGDVLLGTSAPEQTVTVTNVTGSPQQPDRLAAFLNGSGESLLVSAVGFATPPFGGTTTCTDVELAPGDQCTLGYQFRPTSVGPVEEELEPRLEFGSPPTDGPSFAGTQWFWGLYLLGTGFAPPYTPPTFVVDTTPPTLRCEATPSFAVGAAGMVSAVVTDSESGPAATMVSTRADTATAGTKAATLTARDNAGNTATVSCPYVVVAPVLPVVPVVELPATGGGNSGLALAVFVGSVGVALLALTRRRVTST